MISLYIKGFSVFQYDDWDFVNGSVNILSAVDC